MQAPDFDLEVISEDTAHVEFTDSSADKMALYEGSVQDSDLIETTKKVPSTPRRRRSSIGIHSIVRRTARKASQVPSLNVTEEDSDEDEPID